MDRTRDLVGLIAVMVHLSGGEFKFHPDDIDKVRDFVIFQTTDTEGYVTLKLANRKDVHVNEY